MTRKKSGRSVVGAATTLRTNASRSWFGTTRIPPIQPSDGIVDTGSGEQCYSTNEAMHDPAARCQRQILVKHNTTQSNR